jgi:hypothetical protein
VFDSSLRHQYQIKPVAFLVAGFFVFMNSCGCGYVTPNRYYRAHLSRIQSVESTEQVARNAG